MTLPTIVQGEKGAESLVFYDASWEFYETMLREYDEEPSRMSYDDGTLEIAAITTFLVQIWLTWRRSLGRGEPYLRLVGSSLVFFLVQALFALWHTVNTLAARAVQAGTAR